MSKRVLLAVLAAALLIPGRAYSIFGLGKKDKAAGAVPPSDKGESALPGMGGDSASDASAPPRMAQEAAAAVPPPDSSAPPASPPPAAPPAPGAQAPVSDSETAVGDHPSSDSSLPTEVVIKGAGGSKLRVNKPPLNIQVDPFESIRESLKPDQLLLLAESPLTVVWRRTHPEFLQHPRVMEPWRTVFSERPGIVFSPRDQLAEVLQKKVEDKEAKGYQWSLTIADEEGKVFQHYEGSSQPPEELVWSGQNDQGEWIQAGRAYSPVYMFTDPGGTPYTRVGTPLRYKGIVHQERDGLRITMDSAELWGKAKAAEQPQKDGQDLLRAAADLVKRRFTGLPIRVEAYSGSKELADRQAAVVQTYLLGELMLLPQDITTDSSRAAYSDQRVEIVLLNR